MSSNAVVNPETMEKKQEGWSNKYIAIGVMACIGGMIFQLITGSLYQWGIINIYVTSYFKTIDPSETLESNAVAFPIMMFCMGLPMRFGIYLSEIFHPLIIVLTCQILLSVSIFVSSYMTDMWGFIFFYGILFGLLVGSAFMIPIVEINKYFPGKKNYVNGVVLIGTGSGSVVFGMFSYTYLNPERLTPFEGYYLGAPQLVQIAEKVPSLLRFLALLYLVFGLIGIAMMAPVLLRVRREQNQKKAQQLAKKEQAQRNGLPVPQVQVDQLQIKEAQSLKEAFCSWICWIQVAIVLLTAGGLYLINGNYKTYVKKSINDDYFLTIMGAVGAIANGCSRFVWNMFFLKTGYKTVMLVILGASITVYSTIRFTVNIPGAYFIEVLIINFCIGGLLVSTPTVAQVIFGQRTGSNIYGFYWQVVAVSNFIQYLFVSNLSKTIGFDNIIYISLGMACLAVPMVIVTKFQGPWKNETDALGYCIGCGVEEKQNKMDETMENINTHVKVEEKVEAFKQPVKTSPKKTQKLQPLSKENFIKNQIKITLPSINNPTSKNTQLNQGSKEQTSNVVHHTLPPIQEQKKEKSHNSVKSTDESKQASKQPIKQDSKGEQNSNYN